MKETRSILITRPQPVAGEFAARLETQGFKTYIAPMTEYIGVSSDLSVLRECQGIVFTSAQAAQIFAEKREAGRDLPVFCVGDATAAVAAAAGFTRLYSAAGNGADLAELIHGTAGKLHLKKLLHPCSADTPDDISAAVRGLGIDIVRRPVYAARPIGGLPQEVAAAMTAGRIDTVMLFSAKTAENFIRVLGEKGLRGAAQGMEALCLSEPVAAALRGQVFRSVRVAHRPTAEGVVALLAEVGGPKQDRREGADRRGLDRRRTAAVRDEKGGIIAPAYKGEDRRRANRRVHERRQDVIIKKEKAKMVSRSIVMAAFMFIAVVLAGVFLMAPEYFSLGEKKIVSGVTRESSHLSGLAARLMSPSSLGQVQGNISALVRSQGGLRVLREAAARVRQAVRENAHGDITRALYEASVHDGALGAVMGGVGTRDLAPASMLLLLGDLRDDVAGGRPYAADLGALESLAADAPELGAALEKLAPYAERGVPNQATLQTQLANLARSPAGAEPAVARAQARMDAGDVEGAVRELQTVQGANAAVLKPLLSEAEGYVTTANMVEQAVGQLSRNQPNDGIITRTIRKIFFGFGGGDSVYVSSSYSEGDGGKNVLAP